MECQLTSVEIEEELGLGRGVDWTAFELRWRCGTSSTWSEETLFLKLTSVTEANKTHRNRYSPCICNALLDLSSKNWLPPLLPSAGRSPPDVFLVERLSDCDWYEIQSMSGWRRRFGVGAGAVGVVAEVSLSAGWLSVDWGVGGLCPSGLGLRSRWALQTQNEGERLQLNDGAE